jgi:hydrogenase nickel incorporation protein HypA/HybF
MHELAIAASLVESVAASAQAAGAARVTRVFLKLGALSGVSKEALLFCSDVATRDTLLEGSQLVIEDVPVTIYCEHCRAEAILSGIQGLRCPRCGQLSARLLHGKELEIAGIEIDVIEETEGER